MADASQNTNCCGPSNAERVELTRWWCAGCGAVVSGEELRLVAGHAPRHALADGTLCGPVRHERADSHAALLRWVVDASLSPSDE